MDLTVKNEDSREYDMMCCYELLQLLRRHDRGGEDGARPSPFAVMGDGSDPKRVKIRTTQEAKHVLRSRLVNPKWISGMKRHGYKGCRRYLPCDGYRAGLGCHRRGHRRLDVRKDRPFLRPLTPRCRSG